MATVLENLKMMTMNKFFDESEIQIKIDTRAVVVKNGRCVDKQSFSLSFFF